MGCHVRQTGVYSELGVSVMVFILPGCTAYILDLGLQRMRQGISLS